MSLDSPKLKPVQGESLRFGIAAAQYNGKFVEALLDGVMNTLRQAGVRERNITTLRVPGSNEVPFASKLLAESARPDAIIGLGVIIRGGTIHYELIAWATAESLHKISLQTRIPIINGIVVSESKAQARARCLGKINRGAEFALAALAMADLKRRYSR